MNKRTPSSQMSHLSQTDLSEGPVERGLIFSSIWAGTNILSTLLTLKLYPQTLL